MICALCTEPILPGEDRAEILMDAHRECALRSALGGIGHLIDHAHFCRGDLGPDAGLDRRTSALMVDVWVARKGLEAAVKIGGIDELETPAGFFTIRRVADQLEAADARALSVTQFRKLAQGFEELEPGPLAVFGRRRGIFGRPHSMSKNRKRETDLPLL